MYPDPSRAYLTENNVPGRSAFGEAYYPTSVVDVMAISEGGTTTSVMWDSTKSRIIYNCKSFVQGD
jgi:hypothetical protein